MAIQTGITIDRRVNSRRREWWFVLSTIFIATMCGPLCQGQDSQSPVRKKSAQELKVEHARLTLQLAQVELDWAEEVNRKLEQTLSTALSKTEREQILNMRKISNTSIERLKSNVSVGRAQLDLANSPSTGNPEKLQLQYAKEKIRLAKVNLDALKADKRDGKSVPTFELERAELIHRMAKIDLELLGNRDHLATLVDSLQRQIDQIREGMIRQDQRITAVEDLGVRVDR